MRENLESEGARGEWQRVNHKRHGHNTRKGGEVVGGSDVIRSKDSRKLISEGVVSFYFTEFADDFGAKEMWSIFQRYGMVTEVVIPNKRDKRGKRFGFVRFFEVRDPFRFAVRLDNIIIGRQKIFVNLPRFQKDVRNPVRSEAPISRKVNHSMQPKNMGGRTNGRTYAQVAGNAGYGNNQGEPISQGGQGEVKGQGGQVMCKTAKAGQFEFAHLHFKVDDNYVEKLNKSYVGVVAKSGTTYCTQDELTRRGVLDIKATPMGANMVLLEEEVEGTVDSLLTEVWISTWFDELRSWSAREIDNERLVWVRCYGVPVHAWSVEFFSFLISGIGEFICVYDNTLRKKSMDVARILYKTKVHDLVSRLIKVDIGGDVFSIKMTEEWYGPLQWSMPKKFEDGTSMGSDSDEDMEDDAFFESLGVVNMLPRIGVQSQLRN